VLSFINLYSKKPGEETTWAPSPKAKDISVEIAIFDKQFDISMEM